MSVELRDAAPDDAMAIKQLFDEHALAAFGELGIGRGRDSQLVRHAEHLDAARRA